MGECFSRDINPANVVDDTVATYVTDYGVGALCIVFSIMIAFLNRRSTPGMVSGVTEATPLTNTTTRGSTRLVRRTPYKQCLPAFFFFHGVPFIVGGVRHQLASMLENHVNQVLIQTATCSMAFSTSLLLGLGAMEYFIYIRSFEVIKAPLTYLWIIIILVTSVGAAILEKAYLYSALYLLVVTFLYMVVAAGQFKRLGRKRYNLFEVISMVLYFSTIITTYALTNLCAGAIKGEGGIECTMICPLPVGVFGPEALFHSLAFVAVLIFGIAKLGHIKLENGIMRNPPSIVV